MSFALVLNFKMPTIVGILKYNARTNNIYILFWIKLENVFNVGARSVQEMVPVFEDHKRKDSSESDKFIILMIRKKS